ncbi:unnamed protein product, partial [Ectocarpus sp. 12 AP-2014]
FLAIGVLCHHGRGGGRGGGYEQASVVEAERVGAGGAAPGGEQPVAEDADDAGLWVSRKVPIPRHWHRCWQQQQVPLVHVQPVQKHRRRRRRQRPNNSLHPLPAAE